ncbi:MAG: hypothetical protein Q7R70_06170 [Candidatus Diapherotrites archaeon]|nr:hypothetical protein [Candidatus Diapherotrites archaeon]
MEVKITSPKYNEILKVGQKVKITWTADSVTERAATTIEITCYGPRAKLSGDISAADIPAPAKLKLIFEALPEKTLSYDWVVPTAKECNIVEEEKKSWNAWHTFFNIGPDLEYHWPKDPETRFTIRIAVQNKEEPCQSDYIQFQVKE